MKAHDIRYFFCIGGNDSAETVRAVNEQAKAANYDLRAIHIPKAIENDIAENDHSPGFGSAARFVAQAFMGINLDTHALQGVYIGCIMGRHAGFLTAASALAQKYYNDGPHLIYIPERHFSVEKFLADIDRVYSKHGLCTVAVSEGISDANGVLISKKLTDNRYHDTRGDMKLSETSSLSDLLADTVRCGLKVKQIRADSFGILQRSFLGIQSDRDANEAREIGEKAVQFAMWDDIDGSVVINRPVLDYSVDYELIDIYKIAGKTRSMPDNFINTEGNGVTQDFHNYCRPLIGSNMPEPHRLRAPSVAKIINI